MLDGVYVGGRFKRWRQVLGKTQGQAAELTERRGDFVYDLEEGRIRHMAKAEVLDLFWRLNGDPPEEARGGFVADDFTEDDVLWLIAKDPKRPGFIDPKP